MAACCQAHNPQALTVLLLVPAPAGQFNTVSDRLRRFIAVSSTLHMARSYKHQGRDLTGRQEAGLGEACCVAAQALVKDALAVAEVGGRAVQWRCDGGLAWGALLLPAVVLWR